jgi:AraC-like DNA-binding protein
LARGIDYKTIRSFVHPFNSTGGTTDLGVADQYSPKTFMIKHERRSEVLTFAHAAQRLALVWIEADLVRLLSRVCDVLRDIPKSDATQDRVVVALIVRRIADAFVQTEPTADLTIEARQRRTDASDVHITRALQIVRREYATPALSLRAVAAECRVSTSYLSHLLTVKTRHGFRAYVSAVRLLHAAHLLATTALSVEEVAAQCGWNSTAALDREFRRRFQMTPGEFRRWTM